LQFTTTTKAMGGLVHLVSGKITKVFEIGGVFSKYSFLI